MTHCRILFTVAIVAHAGLVAAQTKAPVPNAEAQAKAMAMVKEIYKGEYDAAKTSNQKEALAKKLLGMARQTKTLPDRYALLRVARDLSLAACGPTCFEAVDEMAMSFQIDGLGMKTKVLARCATTARTSTQSKVVAEAGVAIINQALAEDRCDLAQQVITLTASAARKARDGALVKQTADLTKKIEGVAKAYAEMKAAEPTLDANPADPAANLAVGKYLCFFKGDWGKGVSMLALSSDPTIKVLAEKELRGVTTANDQVALADGWWALAEKESGLPKEHLQIHAAGLYKLALPKLSGLLKAKVEKRLSEAPGIGDVVANTSTALPTRPVLSPKVEPKPAKAEEVVYLDDLKEVELKVATWKGNPVFGKHGCGNDGTGIVEIKYKGIQPKHSLMIAPFSKGSGHITYNLNGQFHIFQAIVALTFHKDSPAGSPVTFEVVGDGKLLWKSRPVQDQGVGMDCQVDIRGIRMLTLQTRCSGRFDQAWATWIEPRILKGSGHSQPSKSPKELSIDLPGGVKMEFVLIPAGEFMMGSPEAERQAALKKAKDHGDVWATKRIPTEIQHRVKITRPFYLGKYEVTQTQWQAVMGDNPSKFKNPVNPVEQVSWNDIQPFLAKLNVAFEKKGMVFGLPTEAGWEYACRAGMTTAFCFGDNPAMLAEHGWFKDNSGGKTHPVGQKKPNAWGLYDMHGNLLEWCADWHGDDYYGQSPPNDPTGPPKGSYRVFRGGSWGDSSDRCRLAYRGGNRPVDRTHNWGFRVALVLAVK